MSDHILQETTLASVTTRGGARSGAVQVVQRMGQGGIETLALDLVASGVADKGLFSLQSDAGELIAAWPKLTAVAPILDGFNQGTGFDTQMLRRLAGRLRTLRPRAVLLHHIGPLLYGGLAARLAGVARVIHVEHDAWHYTREPKNVTIAKVADRIVRPRRVAVSNDIAHAVHAFLPRASFTVIPPAIDTARFRPGDMGLARAALGLSGQARVVGTAGRLVDVKGHAVLISALSQLPGDVHVVIAGEGPLAEPLARQAAELGLTDRVHMIGRIDQLENVLPAFNVFALPSLNEGLPRVLLEAQACGLSVAASRVGSIKDAVNPATAQLFAAGDGEGCAQALRAILDQAPLQGASNRAFVETHFSWSNAVAAYRRLIEM